MAAAGLPSGVVLGPSGSQPDSRVAAGAVSAADAAEGAATDASALLGMMYCEFDNDLGPVVRCQVPEGCLGREAFQSISDFVITEKQLSKHVVSVSVGGLFVLGFPQVIADRKYRRNALSFNLAFLFSSSQGQGTAPFESVLRHVGERLCTLELEREFLSSAEGRELMPRLLARVLRDVRARGEVHLPLDGANSLHLRLAPRLGDPPPVLDFQVPVLTRDMAPLLHDDWDLAMRRVLPFVDGVRFVQRIALDAEMDLSVVRECLRQLLYYDCVAMTDVFQYSNTYLPTPRLGELLQSEKLQADAQTFVTRSGCAPVRGAQICAMYCAMVPGLSVRDLVKLYASRFESIDHRRFVSFGVINGLIRRVFEYPVVVSSASSAASAAADMDADATVEQLWLAEAVRSLCTGRAHTDEICCRLMIPYKALRELVEAREGCYFVRK